MFHFQTDSYAGHKASDEYMHQLLDFHDTYMETAQGIYGKLNVTKHTCDLNLFNTVNECSKYLENTRKLFNDMRYDSSANVDLVNLIDGQIQSLNKFIYLLTFK